MTGVQTCALPIYRIILAPFRNCLRKMDELADEDLPAPVPEQYNDLELELKIATAFYNWVQAEKAPPEIETRFRDYVDLVVFELQKKNPQAAAGPGAGAAQAVPPGGPMPPPGPMPPAPGGVPLMPPGPVPAPPTIGAIPPPGAMPMAA